MAKGFNIRAWLGLDTRKFSKGIGQAKGKMSLFKKGLRGVNDTLRGLKFAAIGVTAVGAFSRAVNVIKDFQTNMARVQVLSGATEEQMRSMSDAARDIGENTRFSANEAASGLQYLSMAGFDAEKSLKALPAVMNLAGAGMLDVGRSADIVTNVLQAMSLEADQATRVSDLFAQAQAKSNQTVDELYEGAILAAPAYNSLGLSIEDLTRDMALLANSGVKAEKAGTGLAGALSRLLRQDGMTGDALKDLNVDVSESTIRQEGLIGTIKRLRDAGINSEQRTQIFGLHWKTVGALVNYTDEQIESLTSTIKDNDGAAENMSKKGIGGIDDAIKMLTSALDELIISLGEDGLKDIIESTIGTLRDIVLWLKDTDKATLVLNGSLLLFIGNFFKLKGGLKEGAEGFERFIGKTNLLSKAMAFLASGGGAPLILAAGAIFLIAKNVNDLNTETDKLIEKRDKLKSFADVFLALSNKANGDLSVLSDSELKKLSEASDFLEKSYRSKAAGSTDEDFSKKQLGYADSQAKYNEKIREMLALRAKSKAIAETELKLLQEKQRKLDEEYEAKLLKNAEDKKAAEAAAKAANEAAKAAKERLKVEQEIRDAKEAQVILSTSLTSKTNEGTTLLRSDEVKRAPKTGVAKLSEDYAGEIDTKELFNLEKVATPEALSTLDKIASGLSLASSAALVYNDTLTMLGESMQEFAKEGSETFKQFGADMGNVVRDIIKQNLAVAISGAVSKMLASVPPPYNVIAAAAAGAAATTAFNALIPKFATGGIVGGTSFSGDKVPALVNSGEMILNAGQQATLFKIANEGKGESSKDEMREVEFTIKGDRLVGVLNNYNKKRTRNG